MNYGISGPESHRWHYSSNPSEFGNSHGNNLIIPGLDQNMTKLLSAFLTSIRMACIRFLIWRPFIASTHNPQDTQDKLLKRILQTNAATVFGKQHGFDKIRNYQEYRQAVAVNEYAALEAWIDKQDKDQVPWLTAEQPFFYVLTSGTTGRAKKIPVLKSTLSDYRQSQYLLAYAMYKDIPAAYGGKILAIVSPAFEGKLASGSKYGSMSGLIYQSMPRLLRRKYVVPPKVFELKDYEKKYRVIAAHGLAEADITMIATANPSTLTKLDEVINTNAQALIEEIASLNSGRAQQLHRLLVAKGELVMADVWPNLKAITVWTGGSCGIPLAALRGKITASTRIVEVGYLSSEFRGGVTVDVIANHQVPTIQHNFFEFVERAQWETGQAEFLTLDQITAGNLYYVFVTTQSGLYRYHINDIVEVTGRFNNTPTIQFVQKGKGITNITGEKLSESQLLQVIRQLRQDHGIAVDFFVLLADPQRAEYCLYLEHEYFPDPGIEAMLKARNMEFEEKMNSGRLQPLRVALLQSGAGELYKKSCLADGQRESQFKMMHLQYQQDCRFNFLPLVTEYL